MSQPTATDYLTAVHEALVAAGLPPIIHSGPEEDGPGTYPMLAALIDLDDLHSGIDAQRWPYGLTLIWEWHGDDPDGVHPPGPSWEWGACSARGRLEPIRPLRVAGFAAPGDIVDAVRELNSTGQITTTRCNLWACAGELADAMSQWERDEWAGKS